MIISGRRIIGVTISLWHETYVGWTDSFSLGLRKRIGINKLQAILLRACDLRRVY
jgi:hypothetical protein